MSSAVILTWMEISFVFITVVFCCGSLVRAVTLYRKVPKSSGPGEQLLELWEGWREKSAPAWIGGNWTIVRRMRLESNLFVFVLFDLLGVPLKSVILVFLFFLSLHLRHVLNMHAPTHNGLKCKWQFYTLCFVCLFLMFCFARCIRWRFGLLAPNMRATVYVFERVRSPGVLAVCFCYAFAIYFGLMFTFGSFYVLCVFYSHAILCSRGLNLSFLHRFFLSFFLLNTNLLCLHWVLKTFTSSLIVYQLFFCCFCWSGSILLAFFVWILREFDFSFIFFLG